MEKENIIDFLFEMRENDNSHALNDEVLKELDTNIEIERDKIAKLINKKVHPKSRKQLIYLINQKENIIYEYLHRESQLVYRNGISDGIKLIISALNLK